MFDETREIRLGLRANAQQFWLLVLINAFVGGMVGLERELLPLLGEQQFGLHSKIALLSFIASFGAVKAVANYMAGVFGDRWGRKRVLVAGWLFAIPVPLLIIWAPSWGWIVFANVLLGLNQGLCWSSTVVMKIDLVGPERRGLAMGLNEFAGYLAVALAALGAGLIAHRFGIRPAPFYLGIGFAAIGLGLTLLVRDTTKHHELEAASKTTDTIRPNVFALVTWKDASLASCSQAGLFNNLNDGFAWGLFPLLFTAAHLPQKQISVLIAAYPAAWGLAQLITGALSDRVGRKPMIVAGMILQAAALIAVACAHSFGLWLTGSITLGVGTAMVYPTLLAAIGDVAHPSWRSSAVGVYRFWRDSGYVAGALLAGACADYIGIAGSIAVAALLTFLSGLAVAVRMPGRELLST